MFSFLSLLKKKYFAKFRIKYQIVYPKLSWFQSVSQRKMLVQERNVSRYLTAVRLPWKRLKKSL